jgi:hypothetical protein
LVFRALNVCELVLAAAMLASFAVHPPDKAIGVAAGIAVVALLAQILAVRPALARRSDATLAGVEAHGRGRTGFMSAWRLSRSLHCSSRVS